MRTVDTSYAYRPVRVRSSPTTPMWHPPAMEISVDHRSLQPMYLSYAPTLSPYAPYARRKDASVAGSLSYAPLMASPTLGFYGAEATADPAGVTAAVQAAGAARAAPENLPLAPVKKTPKEWWKSLSQKDEHGVSKASQIAKRVIELSKSPSAPAPVVVSPPQPPGMSPMIQATLVGLVALGVGFGVGYAVGKK